MSTPLHYFVAIVMSILISNQTIIEAIPIGSPKADVESYLISVAKSFDFITRETDTTIHPPYPWMESESGYYQAVIGNVRSKWWLPSFGSTITIKAGITFDGKVSQVVITGARSGFP